MNTSPYDSDFRDQVVARPQADRTLIRRGRVVRTALPSYETIRP